MSAPTIKDIRRVCRSKWGPKWHQVDSGTKKLRKEMALTILKEQNTEVDLVKEAENFMKEDDPKLYGKMKGISIYYATIPIEKDGIFIHDDNDECRHLSYPNKLSSSDPDFVRKLTGMIGRNHIYAFITKYTCEKSGTGCTTRGTKKDRADNEERLNAIRADNIRTIFRLSSPDWGIIEGTLTSGNRYKSITEKDNNQHNEIKKAIPREYYDAITILSPHINTGDPVERYRKFSIFSKFRLDISEIEKTKTTDYSNGDINPFLDTNFAQKDLTTHMKDILNASTAHLDETEGCYRTTNVNGSISWAKKGCLGAMSTRNTIKFTYSSEMVIFKASDKTRARKLTGNELLRFQGIDPMSDMFKSLSDSKKKKIASQSPSYFIINQLLDC
jgi:hypothetical protein